MRSRKLLFSFAALVAAVLVVAGTGPAFAGASAKQSTGKQSAAKQHHDQMVANLRSASAHRATTGTGSSSSSTSRSAKAASGTALSAGITDPTLVYTDCSTTVFCHTVIRDLATGWQNHLPFPGSGCLFEPQLSPDGTQILAVMIPIVNNNCDGTSSVVTISVNTLTYSTLYTAPANAWIDYPNWSPDGATVLFSQEQDDSNGNFVSAQLYTVPAAGGASTALPGGGVEGWDGKYSPDGTNDQADREQRAGGEGDQAHPGHAP